MRNDRRTERRSHSPSRRSLGGRWAAAASSALLCSCAATDGSPFAMNPPAPAADGIVRVAAAPAAGAMPAGSISQVSYDQPAGERGTPHGDASFSPAEPRRAVSPVHYQSNPCGTACPPYGIEATGAAAGGLIGIATPRPDEFLCDGGDAGLPVHYDRTFRHGLEAEDTIGEWSDPAGGHHVTPSNKVCVYAPRFGEVRTFSTPVEGAKVDRLVSANKAQRGVGLDAETYVDTKIQKTKLDATRVRSRASGLETENALAGFDNATAAALNLEDVPPIVNTAFLSRGVMTRGEEAFLAKGIQSAVAWTRTQSPVITATDTASQEVRAEFAPSEIVGLEDRSTPGVLRIVKIADKGAAAVGEVVTFTIRYDNLGDKPVHHIKIVDNLTPRLELVDGSGTSDRAGRLDVEPNGEGSFVLTFVIDEPLPGKTGGVVTFKATVK